jgi:hypothetical protein
MTRRAETRRQRGVAGLLKAGGEVKAGEQASPFRKSTLPTRRSSTRIFTFDVVFRFNNDGEQCISPMGFGPEQRGLDPGFHLLARARPRSPWHLLVRVAGQPEGGLGHAARRAGPHMFRVSKRGNTLTLAITPNYEGKFGSDRDAGRSPTSRRRRRS